MAGDGTTTATLLAQAIIREGMKNLAAGANPMVMRKGIDKAVDAAVEAMKAISKTVDRHSTTSPSVATISSGDEDDRQADRRGHGKGRQRRRHHRGRVQDR